MSCMRTIKIREENRAEWQIERESEVTVTALRLLSAAVFSSSIVGHLFGLTFERLLRSNRSSVNLHQPATSKAETNQTCKSQLQLID